MSRGVNKVIILGRLGRDPEVRHTASGSAVANVSIATDSQWTDKVSGERQEHTEWHRVVFFGRLAEIVQEYLKKGSQAYVEGRLQTRKWQDNTGQDRYTTEIVANEMQMLGSQMEKAAGKIADTSETAPAPEATEQEAGSETTQKNGRTLYRGPGHQKPKPVASEKDNSLDDDDIPF